MNRSIATLAMFALAVVALATGGFLKTFTTTYKVKPTSALGKAKCMVCHTKKSGGALNKYGADLKALGTKIDAAAFKKIEGKDSDGDGMKNGAEIKKGRNPGIKG